MGSPKCQQYDNVGKSPCLRSQFLHLSNENRDPGSAYPREAVLDPADVACMPHDIDLELSKMMVKTSFHSYMLIISAKISWRVTKAHGHSHRDKYLMALDSSIT